MGYRTRFELVKVEPPEQRTAVCARLCELSGYHDPFADEYKWYDHATHAEQVSREFPEVRFEITGIGEDYPDRWTLFAFGGRVEKVQAQISAPAPGWYEAAT